MGICNQGELVYARYFGWLDGEHIFFREVDGKIEKYSCHIGKKVEYYGGLSAGTAWQYVPAELEGELNDPLEIEFVLSKLREQEDDQKQAA